MRRFHLLLSLLLTLLPEPALAHGELTAAQLKGVRFDQRVGETHST